MGNSIGRRILTQEIVPGKKPSSGKGIAWDDFLRPEDRVPSGNSPIGKRLVDGAHPAQCTPRVVVAQHACRTSLDSQGVKVGRADYLEESRRRLTRSVGSRDGGGKWSEGASVAPASSGDTEVTAVSRMPGTVSTAARR